jgi:hypothetical protein
MFVGIHELVTATVVHTMVFNAGAVAKLKTAVHKAILVGVAVQIGLLLGLKSGMAST